MGADTYLSEWSWIDWRLILDYGGSEAWNAMREIDRLVEHGDIAELLGQV